MKKSRMATQDELSELHAMVAKHIKEKIASGEATPADINQAIKFLKDNNIVADMEYNQDLKEILQATLDIDELPFPIDDVQ